MILWAIERWSDERAVMWPRQYIGWSDVTMSMVTIRSPFCLHNTLQCVELNREHLSCYSNKIESVSLRKCSYDHWLFIWHWYRQSVFKRYRSDKHFWEFLVFLSTRWRQKSTGIDMESNYVTVTHICHCHCIFARPRSRPEDNNTGLFISGCEPGQTRIARNPPLQQRIAARIMRSSSTISWC